MKEMPNDVAHTCGRGPLHLKAVKFAMEVYEKCSEALEATHPSLHAQVLIKHRNKIEKESDKNKFDDLIAESYTFKSMKSTMARRRNIILGPEPKDHASCDFTTYPDIKDNVMGIDRGDPNKNDDIWLFGSPFLAKILTSAKSAGVDCTFKITPQMW